MNRAGFPRRAMDNAILEDVAAKNGSARREAVAQARAAHGVSQRPVARHGIAQRCPEKAREAAASPSRGTASSAPPGRSEAGLGDAVADAGFGRPLPGRRSAGQICRQGAPSSPRWRSCPGAGAPGSNGIASRPAARQGHAKHDPERGKADAERLHRELQRPLPALSADLPCKSPAGYQMRRRSRRLAMPARKSVPWQHDYNHHRPHSALGNIPPAEFVTKKGLEMRAA